MLIFALQETAKSVSISLTAAAPVTLNLLANQRQKAGSYSNE